MCKALIRRDEAAIIFVLAKWYIAEPNETALYRQRKFRLSIATGMTYGTPPFSRRLICNAAGHISGIKYQEANDSWIKAAASAGAMMMIISAWARCRNDDRSTFAAAELLKCEQYENWAQASFLVVRRQLNDNWNNSHFKGGSIARSYRHGHAHERT